MKCPRCDAKLDDSISRCNHCGQDLAMLKHVYRLSNTYYNIGLEKAHVRDLTGAVESLKKSLQYNKRNTNARNLLGLVYCEMGETVAALSEWVLSKYLQPEDNPADAYIDTIQANPVGLDNVNQTIKKYNAALTAAQTGNEDLAIIQLKKVVALNPGFVRALQLLALLYMKMEDYPKAYKHLKQAKRVDSNNTTTLRYMKEVYPHLRRPQPQTRQTITRPQKDPLANVTPVGSYHEEKKSWLPYINVLIGLVVGILVTFFLIRPTMKNTGGISASELSEVNNQLAVKTTELSTANKENETLKKQVEDLKKKISGGMDGETKYKKLLEGVSLYMEGKTTEAAANVASYKASDFDMAEAKALYQKIAKKLDNTDANNLFLSGRDKYNSGKYEEAIEDLTKALAIEPENQDALYFMGRVYHRKQDYKKAKEYYNKVLSVDENSSRAAEARNRLNQVKAESGAADTEESEATPTPAVD